MTGSFKRYEVFTSGSYTLTYYSIKTLTANSTQGFFCKEKKVLIKFYSKRQVQRFKNFLLFLTEKNIDIENLFDHEPVYFYYFAPEYIRTAKKYNTQILYGRLHAVQKNTIAKFKR